MGPVHGGREVDNPGRRGRVACSIPIHCPPVGARLLHWASPHPHWTHWRKSRHSTYPGWRSSQSTRVLGPCACHDRPEKRTRDPHVQQTETLGMEEHRVRRCWRIQRRTAKSRHYPPPPMGNLLCSSRQRCRCQTLIPQSCGEGTGGKTGVH